ncbi:MAG: hypothetical protein H7X88_03015, partial [Gloeobacteraceae cyanobacterium ES-bin-316]|nr:hypothetical protein [Ferruginibacter sp.]
MKQPFIVCYAILLLCCFCGRQSLFAQNVGIGTNTPHAKAALEVRSTDKGVLFPTLTTVQRNLITNPPNGLHIFNTDERCLNY